MDPRIRLEIFVKRHEAKFGALRYRDYAASCWGDEDLNADRRAGGKGRLFQTWRMARTALADGDQVLIEALAEHCTEQERDTLQEQIAHEAALVRAKARERQSAGGKKRAVEQADAVARLWRPYIARAKAMLAAGAAPHTIAGRLEKAIAREIANGAAGPKGDHTPVSARTIRDRLRKSGTLL